MTTETNKWTLLTCLNSEHRIFRNQHGRMAIADNSGKYPESTEDGILWIEPEGVPVILEKWSQDRVRLTLTVNRDGLDDSCVVVSLDDAEVLYDLGFRFVVNNKADTIIEAWRKMIIILGASDTL